MLQILTIVMGFFIFAWVVSLLWFVIALIYSMLEDQDKNNY